jgi:hypothetical protein
MTKLEGGGVQVCQDLTFFGAAAITRRRLSHQHCREPDFTGVGSQNAVRGEPLIGDNTKVDGSISTIALTEAGQTVSYLYS